MGVRSGALTLLENNTQTESKYLRQWAFKDVGTVRNMVRWVVVISGCMYARHDDAYYERDISYMFT